MFLNIIILLASVLVIYIPVFTTPFGIHSDYSLLSSFSLKLMDFVEAKQMHIVGQIISGWLMSWQSYLTPSIEALGIWRFIGFIFSSLAICFLLRLALKQGLDKNLLAWSFLSAIVLPGVNVGFIWAVHVFPGAVNLLLSLVAYCLFDLSLNGYRLKPGIFSIIQFVCALLFVFISLWVYFPTACAFLLIGYLKVLWPNPEERTLYSWVRDIIFFTTVIGIYVCVDRLIVSQWVASTASIANIIPTDGINKFALLNKLRLLGDVLVVSWQGLWHVFGQSAIWFVLAEIATFVIFMIYGGCRWLHFWYRLLVNVFVALVLIAITQMPSLLAPGMIEIKGYRVLVVPMLVLFMLKIWMMDGVLKETSMRIIRPIAVGWYITILSCALLTTSLTVNRHAIELMGLERAVMHLRSKHDVKVVDVLPVRLPNDMVAGRVLSEYNYTMRFKEQLQPAFNALCLKYQILPNRFTINVVEKNNALEYNSSHVFVNLLEILQ